MSFISFLSVQENPEAINDIRDDVRSECEKFGEVKKVLIHDVSCNNSPWQNC